MLKFQGKICLENILFVSKSLNNVTLSGFFEINIVMKPHIVHGVTSNRHGKYSVTASANELRNKIQKQLKDMLLKDLSPRKIKELLVIFKSSLTM